MTDKALYAKIESAHQRIEKFFDTDRLRLGDAIVLPNVMGCEVVSFQIAISPLRNVFLRTPTGDELFPTGDAIHALLVTAQDDAHVHADVHPALLRTPEEAVALAKKWGLYATD